MAFDNLSNRLQKALKAVRGKSKITEDNIEEMLREVRLSLLEADVNYKVVKSFLNGVKEKAIGTRVMDGLNPGEQLVKIVREELQTILGSTTVDLNVKSTTKTIIMTCGLQGSGKTTAIGKMAVYLRKKYNKKPFLIAADIYRPAAIDQLVTLGRQIDVPVFDIGINHKAVDIVKQGLKKAYEDNRDLIIIDTAGRLHIDDDMMQELVDVKNIAKPDEILLVVDAMTGQDAVNVAQTFHEKLTTTGVVLTKMDGDTRGGAALSIKVMTGVPIKLMSVGEKMDDLEVFHPERLADRILGMGDVVSLIEQVQDSISEDEAMSMMERMTSDKYNYYDLLKQFKMIKKMGSFSKILGFLPGVKGLKEAAQNVDDKQLVYMEAIISSMTDKERKNPKLIDESFKRRERIAKGSGRSLQEVNQLRTALAEQKRMMKSFSGMSEEEIQKKSKMMQNNPMPSGYAPKPHKGKGKGKGGFRKGY